jgi:Phage major capsid protein E
MPEISLLEPVVLRGVVEKFVVPETLMLLNRLDQTPWPFPSATWDVVKGSRAVAKPNVPNSEAHIISRLGRSQESASFIYLREKKVFEPTTLHWLRTPGEIARINAERAVLREINDLNQRFDNFMEWSAWQALGGGITYNYADVQAVVDYKFPSSHFVTPATPWVNNTALTYYTAGGAGTGSAGNAATLGQANTRLNASGGTITYASPVSMIEDVRSWKRLLQVHGRVPAKEVFATSVTMAALMEAWVSATQASTVSIPATMLSDRMKDEFYSTGIMTGFMGLTWSTVEQVFESDLGNLTFFVPDGQMYMGNYSDQRPIEVMIGPTADDEAPEGFTGKFAKTWKEKDPSARQYLLELHFLPIITRPEQMLVATGIIGTTGGASVPAGYWAGSVGNAAGGGNID